MPSFNEISAVRHASAPAASGKKKLLPGMNMPFLMIVAVLVCYGLLVVFSAVSVDEDYNFTRQLAGVAVGAVAMLVVWNFDYRRLADCVGILLIINVLLILSPHLPIIGVSAKGAQSWIKIGIQVQPGEFAKVTVILLDAAVMARYDGRLDDPMEYCKALGLMLIPFFCIMTQPDLGTGLVYLFIAGVALVMGGAKARYILISIGVAVAMVALVFLVDGFIKNATGEYKLLKQYQRNRLLVFLNEDYDPTGEGYNLAQAKIAIGSGGIFGTGLFNGSQHALGLLPEAPTDFIFCVLAEELGFVGVMFLLALYVALIFHAMKIALRSNDLFGMLVVSCVCGMWLFQILENIGMDCGLMPITGIPLPFMSYGSSFMVVNFIMIGMIGSVWKHNTASDKKVNYAGTR